MKQILQIPVQIVTNDIISDLSNGEGICSKCGVIVEDHLSSKGYNAKYKINSDYTNKGIGISLAQFDKGLSTEIPSIHVDPSGNPLYKKQISSARSLRYWEKTSKNNRSIDRNFRTVFPILLRIKDRLSLNHIVIEKLVHQYRRVIDLRLTKARSIVKLVAEFVYLNCKELGFTSNIRGGFNCSW